MFVINEDNSIYVTRGDIVYFDVTAQQDGADYSFSAGDVLRVSIFEKNNAENVVMRKDFPVIEDALTVPVYLSEEDTKLGEPVSKPTDYWWEIELNPGAEPMTIVGYDEDGPKIFRIFPEGDAI